MSRETGEYRKLMHKGRKTKGRSGMGGKVGVVLEREEGRGRVEEEGRRETERH